MSEPFLFLHDRNLCDYEIILYVKQACCWFANIHIYCMLIMDLGSYIDQILLGFFFFQQNTHNLYEKLKNRGLNQMILSDSLSP